MSQVYIFVLMFPQVSDFRVVDRVMLLQFPWPLKGFDVLISAPLSSPGHPQPWIDRQEDDSLINSYTILVVSSARF